jgi:outer membrane protein TolC
MERSFLLFTLFLCSVGLYSQSNDTIVLFPDDFLHYVSDYHPVAFQASLVEQQGASKELKARGFFDPKLYSDLRQKDLKGKDYWDLFNGGVKIPTWFGIEVKTGVEYAYGTYYNRERETQNDQLGYLGISVPVGKGLFIDERRAALRQAQAYRKYTEQKRREMVNDLFYNALLSYWDWVKSYRQMKVFEVSVDNAKQRLEVVKRTFQAGEMTKFDTIEALSQVQAIQLNLSKSKAEYQSQTLMLSTYLWDSVGNPLQITSNVIPPSFDTLLTPEDLLQGLVFADSLSQQVESALDQHPTLLGYTFKIQELDVERRFKAESLKPTLNLNYNLLTAGYQTDFGAYSTQNYKWGLEFEFPIFLRKARGDLRYTKLKLQEYDWKYRQKELEIKNKINSYRIKMSQAIEQVRLYQSVVKNYQTLLRAEELKMLNGESTLFKVNARELKLYEAQQKLAEVMSSYMQYKAAAYWSAALFIN